VSDPPTKFESYYKEARNAPPCLRAAGSTVPVWSRNSERVLNPRLEKMQAG
jgi:hypothetical protein